MALNRLNPTVFSTADKFYYDAVLLNEKTGDSADVPARFVDNRTIPLLEDTTGFNACLTHFKVMGATTNLPIMRPPVLRLTAANEAPYIHTSFVLGVKYMMYLNPGGQPNPPDPAVNPSTVYVSQMLTVPIRIPSMYPNESRTDYANSRFYWVMSQRDLVDGLNVALRELNTGLPQTIDATTQQTTLQFYLNDGTTPIGQPYSMTPSQASGGFEFPTVDWPIDHSNQTNGTNGAPVSINYPWQTPWYATLDVATRKVSIHVQQQQNPTEMFSTPNPDFITEDSLHGLPLFQAPGWTFGMQLYFNTDLLTVLPFNTMANSQAYGNYVLPSIPSSVSKLRIWPNQVLCPGLNPSKEYVQYGLITPQVISTFYPLSLVQSQADVVFAPNTFVNFDFANGHPTYPLPELVWTQEFQDTADYAVYTGFALASGAIGCYPTVVSVNRLSNATGTAGASNTDLAKILFTINTPLSDLFDVQDGYDYRPYYPLWVKLLDGQSLQNIDITLYLRRKDGGFDPWIIDGEGAIQLQIVFTKNIW